MDNISKKSLIHNLANLSSVILFTVPLLADTLGIISFFIPALQTWVNTHFESLSSIIILSILNTALIANIIFSTERRIKKRAESAMELAKGYESISSKYADYLMSYEERCENIATINELYTVTSECLKTIIDELKNIICDITGEKVRVCIKCFPEKYGHKDVTKMQLVTFCRSDKSLRESALERSDKVEVNNNTDFKLIMLDTYPYFAFNGLTSFERETGMIYENSTPRWKERYNATIVYPISKCTEFRHFKQQYEVLGFLCADSISTKAFSGDVGRICIKLIASVSFLLYVFLDKCITYREKIEKTQQGQK